MAPRAAARLESLGFENVYEYAAGKLDWMAAGLETEGESSHHPRAGDVARKDVPIARLDETVGEVARRVAEAGWNAAVVLDGERKVLGLLRSEELKKDRGLLIEDAMRPGPSTFRPYVPIKEVADYMVEHELASSPITRSDGTLVGLLLRSDAVEQAAGCPDCARKML